jgi:hypothetical protein
MTKRTIRETVKEYDEKGNVIRETVTETTENDDTVYYPYYAPTPYTPINTPTPWWNVPEATTVNATTIQNIM